jgi:hypothetical protein
MNISLQLCRYLISTNQELIENTAIKNCHAIGLNSFIINQKPKIRLFIADPHCELFNEFDYLNPLIPIHPHKYDDIFIQLEGELIHHLYDKKGKHPFNKYKFYRLSDKEKNIILTGNEKLNYLGSKTNIPSLKANELHTVSLKGKRCSWLIIETFQDSNFEQIAYHQDLKNLEGLYQKFENATEYLKSYFINEC